jgi:hypothetical protein
MCPGVCLRARCRETGPRESVLCSCANLCEFVRMGRATSCTVALRCIVWRGQPMTELLSKARRRSTLRCSRQSWRKSVSFTEQAPALCRPLPAPAPSRPRLGTGPGPGPGPGTDGHGMAGNRRDQQPNPSVSSR